MPVLTATPAVNEAIADARSLPGLVSNLQAVDPALATQLESKPLLASRSPPGVLAVTALTFLSARYGLGWDETTCSLLAGVALTGAAYALRWITRQPVAGIVATPGAK